MIKKMTAFVVIFVMVAAMWIIPSSASTFTDSIFFNADFNTGSFDDTVGGVKGQEYYNKGDSGNIPSEFTNASDIGRKVITFHMASAVYYKDFQYNKFETNFTLEAYVKLPKADPVQGWGVIAGTYWNNNPNSGIGFSYGQHAIAKVGANRKFSIVQGDGTNSSTTFTGARADGQWMHLVYTRDDKNESYYENGALVGTQAVKVEKIPSVPDNDAVGGFRIGGYNKVSQFCMSMDCAYVRAYSSPATESDVKALYENRNQDAAVPSGNGTVAKPTNQPSNGNSGSNNSSNKTNNASTFDLGIVSLAAVTLSSAVVAKKRRR